MDNRIEEAKKRFKEIFGDEEGVSVFSAPGRIEIGGNHTDHQHGCVLAASIDKDSIAVARPREDQVIRVFAEGFGDIMIDIGSIAPGDPEQSTRSLIAGVVCYLREHGFNVGGFDAYTTSNILTGAGLSSSASYETLIGTILSGFYNDMKISPVETAKAGKYSENVFFGKPCGLMDQMACSLGGLVYIDLKDPGDPSYRRISCKDLPYSAVVTDTKGSHADLTLEYASIPDEMRKVANCLGKEFLRDVNKDEIIGNMKVLRERCGDRAVLRALHFEDENIRAGLEAQALEKGDFRKFIELINESGDSSFKYLQNIYAPSSPKDQAISIALKISSDILGKDEAVRVHGGGFAGTILAFVLDGNVARYKACMEAVFGKGSCEVLRIRDEGGMRIS